MADRRYIMVKPEKEWPGLKTIVLTRNTVIGEEGEESVEERYFISSLPIGDRRDSQGSAWALDGRELSLAFGCNILGRWEPYDREAGSI